MNFVAIQVLAQTPPLLAGLFARGRSNCGRRWMVAWGAFSVIEGVIQMALESRGASKLLMSLWLPPVDGTLTLLALACWQDRPNFRAIYRWTAATTLLLQWSVIALWSGSQGIQILGAPLYGVLGVAAALFTFVDRSLRTDEPLMRLDWFWVSGCLTFYSAVWSVMPPLLRWARDNAPTIYADGRNLFMAFAIIAPAVVTVGLLCPVSERDARVARSAA